MQRTFVHRGWPILTALALGSASSWAQGDEGQWTTSAKVTHEVASGTYGTSTNSVTRTTGATFSLDSENYAFDIDLPYVEQSGPSRLVNVGGRKQVLRSPATQDASGMGDVSVGATRYLLNEETAGADLDVGTTLKLPTASAAKGLGTGRADLSVRGTLSKSHGSLYGSATVGYTFVGQPAGQRLRDTTFGSVDLSYKLDAKTKVGATYSAASPIAAGSAGARDLLVYAERRFTERFGLELFVGHGYSTQSPDHTVGVAVSVSL